MQINKPINCCSTDVQNLSDIDSGMKRKTALLAVILIGLSAFASQPAFAGKVGGWAQARGSFVQYAVSAVPLSQVLETINAQEPGTQLDTNTVVENGRTIYVVRWQASRGRIIIFRVDAETGQIIGRQG
jgi:uncharacterized iron-regulated membrane protein